VRTLQLLIIQQYAGAAIGHDEQSRNQQLGPGMAGSVGIPQPTAIQRHSLAFASANPARPHARATV
jgi:hypothetical protein